MRAASEQAPNKDIEFTPVPPHSRATRLRRRRDALTDKTSPLVRQFIASPNHDERVGNVVDILLLHYTGMPDADGALMRLCAADSKVSSHYLVRENGEIIQLVPEERRAWHAGVSNWRGYTDINSRSIGIEIANAGHDGGCPDYPPAQIEAVIALCRDILGRWPIPPDQVLAHSDVAPTRKQDPGEYFPWERLHESGIGLWSLDTPPDDPSAALDSQQRTRLLQMLETYGYGVVASGGEDDNTAAVIAGFQRHFRPQLVNGIADLSTLARLEKLLSLRDAKA
ncbi:MAG: N-acetylmuramoyl-L-alanine amidase [Xanthobacteraceae bacterium]|nr:N-acetylmuramoyl-L-alanine amidase [Xanthobacteraceae bacterium]